MHGLLKRSLEEGVKGYKVLAEFRHFLRISYKDQAEQRHTRTIEVSERGYTDVADAEWDQVHLDPATRPYFDFDSMSADDFMRLVQKFGHDEAR